MKTVEKLRKNVYLLYTLLFLITAFFAFFWFIFYGKTFIYKVDAYLQHYSFLVKLRRFITDIFGGNGVSLWSWDSGLGSDTIGNFAIVFCDPFAYIAAAFKPKYIDIGYTISVILRLYFAGITMMAFLRYREKSSFQTLVGGIAYAFSAWAVGCIRHAFFLNPLLIFPLLILGVDKIDKEKKPLIFILSIVFSIITSFYFSYMSAILVIVYIVAKYFLENENRKSLRDFFKRFFKFVLYAIIALFISAPILIPVFYTLINANKTSGVQINVFYVLKDALRYVPSYISNMEINENYSYTSLSMICLAMIPAMILDFKKKINRLPSVMALICAVMAAFPVFGSIFNGFSYSVGRWCYMFAFFLVWASVSALDFEKFKEASYKKSFKTILSVMIVIFAVSLILGKMVFNVFPNENLYTAMLNLIFLVVFANLVCSEMENRRISKTTVIITLMVANIGLVYLIDYSPNLSNELSNYLDVGKAYNQYSDSAQRVGTEIEDDDFYRIDQVENSTSNGYIIYTHTPANDNMFFGTRSIYSYISTIDNRIFDYNKALCNSAGYYRRICTNSNDNRSRINFLQGVKYFIGDDPEKNIKVSQYAGYGFKKYKNIEGIEVLKSRYKASLGYVFENTISEKEFMKYDFLDREQIMMQACLADEKDTSVSNIDAEDISLDSKKISYTVNSESGLKFRDGNIDVTSEDSRLTIITDEIKNSEVCVVFKNLKKKPATYDEFKNEMAEENINSKIEEDKFDAENISYYSYENFVVYVNKPGITKRLLNADGDNQGFSDVENYIANMGYYESTDGIINIDFKTIGEYTFDSIEVIAVSQKNFDEQAKKLEDNRLNVTEFYDNYVKGTVDSDYDGVLYLNIPYNDGWKVYIDGEEQETYIADIAFIGTDIKKGKHIVELKYRPVGFKISLIMGAAGVAALSVVLIFRKKKNKSKKN